MQYEQSAVIKMPPLPIHDQKRDGNPFAWIVELAPRVREERAEVIRQHRETVKSEY